MNIRPVCVGLSYSLLLLVGVSVRAADKPAFNAPEVPVARPMVREVTDHEDFTGRTEAISRVDLRARLTGYLLKSSFQEGSEVKQGDVLFEIDPRPYRAELDKTEAALLRALARLKLAQSIHKRAAALLAQKVVSPEEVDRAVAECDEAEAAVLVAKASREAARLNLDFTRVHAPINGRVGRRLLDPGNLVKADETILATLVSRDPMYVYFNMDERSALHLLRSLREAKDADRKLPVSVGLPGEEGFPRRGVVDFTDNHISPDTGTLRMRATLPNKDGLLMPGLFARVRLTIGQPYKALLIPSQAVMVEEGTRFVFVVNDKDAIVRRPVVLGAERDGQRVVSEGLKPDERVVVGRLQGLRPGMAVRPVKTETPPSPAPGPGKSGADARPVRVESGPVVLVETVYPGANAQVVADTVAAPIEQQVRGVEKLLFMRSQCTQDGKYTLALIFARGVDVKTTQVLVRNRVSLALPALPEIVRRREVRVRERGSGVCLIVSLFSPDDSRDVLYLSNYASIQLKDELSRLPGVNEVTLVGQLEYGLRVRLDPDRLAALNLNASEIMQVIDKQKAGGDMDADKLSDLLVKTDGAGRQVHLRDVARIELGAGPRSGQAFLNGKPVVALAVHPAWGADPRKLGAELRDRLSALRARFPDGLDLAVSFDLPANRSASAEFLLLDLDLPIGASPQRVLATLKHCQKPLRRVPGVQDVLTLSENPFDLFGSGPCILVRLAAAKKGKVNHEENIRTIRSRLDEVKEMTLRVRDEAAPGRVPRWGYPIDLAVHGPDAGRVRTLAKALVERLNRSKKLIDVWANADATPRLQRTVEINRVKAADMGVSVEDILNTLRVYHGSLYVNDFDRFGRTWQITIQAEAGAGDKPKVLRNLKVRNARGEMVPLSALAAVREVEGPHTIDFFDGRPMVRITANPASGASGQQVRTLCEHLAKEAREELRLPAEYRLSWLQELPGSK